MTVAAGAVLLLAACVTTAGTDRPRPPTSCPRITSDYGALEGYRVSPHTGIDIGARYGAPVLAAAPGVVVFIGDRRPGNLVSEATDRQKSVAIYHGGMLTPAGDELFVSTSYDHLSRFAEGLRDGDFVRRGQHIGANGASGATGPVGFPHIHFGVRVTGTPKVYTGLSRRNPHDFWWQAGPGERAIHAFDPDQDYGDPTAIEWMPETRISGLTYPAEC